MAKRTFDVTGKASLRDRAYRDLKAAIIENRLHAGTSFSEYRLAKILGMSRTPVREALGRLASEGFVVATPDRGAVVRPVTAELALEVMEYREAIEGLACKLAATRMNDATLAKLQQIFLSERPPDGLDDLNRIGGILHAAVRDSCGNAMLQRSLDRIRDHLARLRSVATDIPGRVEQSFKDHQEIVEALKSQDGERAEAAMRKHISGAKDSIFHALFENRLRPAGPARLGVAPTDRTHK